MKIKVKPIALNPEIKKPLAMQLAVGLSPVGNGLLVVLVAGVLLFSLGGKSIWSYGHRFIL